MKPKQLIKSVFLFIGLFSTTWLSAQAIKVDKFVLKNGLTVFLHEDHTKAEIFGAVITNAGAKNDPPDATGMAHYQEHVLFKGTQTLGTTDWENEKPHIDEIFKLYDQLGATRDEEERKQIQQKINEESLKAAEYAIPNEFSNIVKKMGGTDLNAYTSPDNTVFFNAFPPSQIEKWLDLYSHRFIDPVFRSFQAELEIVYEEKNMYEDEFTTSLIEKFNAHFFKNHPYGQQTIIGTTEDLKNPSLTKMYEFFKTWYVANNMALVLSGDFNAEEVLPMIEEKFGRWESGELPDMVNYPEEEFKGREFVEGRMSPIKLGLLGFRTAPNGHEDLVALSVCNNILSNDDETGIIDQLMLNNDIMMAMLLPYNQNDHGGTILLFVPKILGQKLETAEKMVLAQLQKVKRGEFDDWMVEAAKNILYRDYQYSLESNESKALFIGEAFGMGVEINERLMYPEKLKAITKEDIINVANKYYGENFLAFYSKMGSHKKDKIDKPEYEALTANTNAKSEYALENDSIPVLKLTPRFIDFEKDVIKSKISGGEFYFTQNPVNDIFTLEIKFGIGHHEMPLIMYASDVINYASIDSLSTSAYKNEFSKLGCSYYVMSDNSYLTIAIDGIEENLEEALILINKLITQPQLAQHKINILIENEKAGRKFEDSETDVIAWGLNNYVRLGKKSPGLNRLSLKEIKNLQADTLLRVFRDAVQFEVEIHYVGRLTQAQALIEENIQLGSPAKASQSPVELKPVEYKENTVYFVHHKKAVQSKVYFFGNGKPYEKKDQAVLQAFNLYFGGDFSGLVLQEIREYRSLAYSAYARYQTPMLSQNNCSFMGFIGTQADKTNESLTVFNGLVREMPQKPERMEMISDYLVESAISKQPGFRDRSEFILSMKRKGFNQDPVKELLPAYKELDFDDILNFWEGNIKEMSMVIAIVGNKKAIDMKELEKYGKVVYLKKEDLFKK